MALYGSVDAAKALLRASVGSAFNADQEGRLTALHKAVSALIDRETGRTFGTGPAATEVVAVRASGVSDVLILPRAVRTVSGVTVGAGWAAGAWTGGTALGTGDWRLVYRTQAGEYLGLLRVGGAYWLGDVLVAGTWEDADADNQVPDDITYVANLLMAEFFKREQQSSAAQIGPDGTPIFPRNPLKDPMVATTLDKYRVAGATALVV